MHVIEIVNSVVHVFGGSRLDLYNVQSGLRSVQWTSSSLIKIGLPVWTRIFFSPYFLLPSHGNNGFLFFLFLSKLKKASCNISTKFNQTLSVSKFWVGMDTNVNFCLDVTLFQTAECSDWKSFCPDNLSGHYKGPVWTLRNFDESPDWTFIASRPNVWTS